MGGIGLEPATSSSEAGRATRASEHDRAGTDGTRPRYCRFVTKRENSERTAEPLANILGAAAELIAALQRWADRHADEIDAAIRWAKEHQRELEAFGTWGQFDAHANKRGSTHHQRLFG
jgi:hypothetical protein